MTSPQRPPRDLRAPYLLLRTHRDLRLLLGANVVSQGGDWILGVGLAYAVYDLTGSTMASAVTLLAAFLPQVVAGPLAGVLVDRWDRRRTMLVANLVMAAGLTPLLLVTDAERVWLVYLVLVGQSVVEVFFAPAEQAFLPRLVADGDLVTANVLNGQARQVARLLGGGLGGVAAAVGGVPAVAAADAVTFVVAALLVAAIRTSGRTTPGTETEDEPATGPVTGAVTGLLSGFGTDLRGGLRAAARERTIRVLMVYLLITQTGEGVMGTLFAPFVRDELHGSGQVYGVISGVQAVGGLLGGLVVASLASRWSPALLLGVGSVLFGCVDLAIFVYPTTYDAVWPAVLGMVLVGIPGAACGAGLMTLVQRHTTDAERGRVFSLVTLAGTVAVVAGTATAGFLGERVGIIPVLACQGVGYVLAGGLVLVSLRARESQERVEDSGEWVASQAPRM
ncbi:putative MFS family arabinose efflux permease [Nocardioides ginsengisegetis]|uniref:Putative MFS family arabinose efflux permease n=1 Tax=Nocardioides ginsengisegetis TaxID=661491 RepID=A0A7W3P9Y8_9ACTN|nr:MFS transporter [Nocardioides ginsengisegetis]MBA8803924.1 putative MFS family arabinose efflux permease [Nocardioides ginsengisegetis]